MRNPTTKVYQSKLNCFVYLLICLFDCLFVNCLYLFLFVLFVCSTGCLCDFVGQVIRSLSRKNRNLRAYFFYLFSSNSESQNVNMELVLDQKAYLEEINRSLTYVFCCKKSSFLFTKRAGAGCTKDR